MLICGGGVRYSGAGEILGKLARRFGIPVGETQAGKGEISWDHPMNLGGLGVTGTSGSNRIAHQADCVIAVGTRLNDFHTGSKWNFHNPDMRLVTLNINNFDAWKMNAHPFVADAKSGLEALYNSLTEQNFTTEWNGEVEEARHEWVTENDRLYGLDSTEGLMQTRVMGLMNEELVPRDAVVVCASGSLPSDMERLWRVRVPGTYHLEYGFSCMGYEVPGALGAKLACPDREVYCLVGDGGYSMLHSELFTSIQEGVKINIVLIDNHGFQCIDNLQGSKGIPHFGCEFRYRDPETEQLSGDYVPVDFAMNARSWGARAWTVRTEEELKKAFEEARKSPVSTLIEVKTVIKSMSEGYDSWWRVGIPEVSPNEKVVQAAREQEVEIKKAKAF